MTEQDEKLLKELRAAKWSRYRDVAAQAARRIEQLSEDRAYWQQLWQKASNRLLEIDPEADSKSTTVVDRIRKLDGVMEPRQPDPWKDA